MKNHNTDKILKSLQELYTKKQYKKGIDLLLSHKQDLSPQVFHYNLGALYIKTGKLGVARYHFEKSIKKGAQIPMNQHNIDAIKQNLKLYSPQKWSSEYLYEKTLEYPFSSYLGLSGLFALILLFLIKKRNISNYLMAFVFTISPIIFYSIFVHGQTQGIALQEIQGLEGPSKIFEKVTSIPEGTKVILGKKNGPWYYITYPKKYTSWISQDQLGLY